MSEVIMDIETKSRIKTFVINTMGLLTTLAMVAVIYIILYLDGAVGEPDNSVLIEFVIITGLAVYCKIFWYKSSENSVRTSKQYIEDRQALSDEIDASIDDPYQFDDFISTENTLNYNRYMDSKCKHLTLKNYKLKFIDKWYDFWHYKQEKIFHLKRYILRCERRARRINQLSASRITSGSQCYLVDDRNFSRRHKFNYIVFGTVISIAMFGLMSIMVFKRKEDIDPYVVAIKMVTYITSMIFNILSTIISATSSTKTDDYDYMRRIYKILDRFSNYKKNKQLVVKIDYIELLESKEIENDIPNCEDTNQNEYQSCKENCENSEDYKIGQREDYKIGQREIIESEVNNESNNKPVEKYVQQQFDLNSI